MTGLSRQAKGWFVLLGSAAFACALVFAPLAVGRSSTTCSVCGTNLVQNPGAESGPGSHLDTIVTNLPDWTRVKGGFTVVTYTWPGGNLTPPPPVPANHGANYFYGGPGKSGNVTEGNVAEATQTISLNGDPAVAAGLVHATLAGWLGGATNHQDNARVKAIFLGPAGHVIDWLFIGPAPPTSGDGNDALHYKSATGLVPHGAASVRIAIIMTRYSQGRPTDNNGMADNLSLVLTCKTCSSS